MKENIITQSPSFCFSKLGKYHISTVWIKIYINHFKKSLVCIQVEYIHNKRGKPLVSIWVNFEHSLSAHV